MVSGRFRNGAMGDLNLVPKNCHAYLSPFMVRWPFRNGVQHEDFPGGHPS
uniref:Uncharacterized protein n=1 Tax=Brassica oleracea TaxID=3712 RepID=A0A3P6BXQ8_BRAOL|nr:unnamed protein product [Brassica oleracea]